MGRGQEDRPDPDDDDEREREEETLAIENNGGESFLPPLCF